jgi:Zn-dependent protease
MLAGNSRSFRLFKLFGIEVFVHWSWFLVAAFQFYYRPWPGTPYWHAATYLSMFAIVTLHEFGHALACRSVGGRAESIILWPLGGIAFVRPPQRPGPVLWSIAAGPLVNVLLIPVTMMLWVLLIGGTEMKHWSDLQWFVASIAGINGLLLAFNLLPIYPLDGGQIVQAILWFFMGRARSLNITATFGLICAVGLGALALWAAEYWLLLMALFLGFQAYNGRRMARVLASMDAAAPPPYL